jgi:hypothetical protein
MTMKCDEWKARLNDYLVKGAIVKKKIDRKNNLSIQTVKNKKGENVYSQSVSDNYHYVKEQFYGAKQQLSQTIAYDLSKEDCMRVIVTKYFDAKVAGYFIYHCYIQESKQTVEWHDASGKKTGSQIQIFDAAGNLIKDTVFDSQGTAQEYVINAYVDKCLQSATKHLPDGRIEDNETCIFDGEKEIGMLHTSKDLVKESFFQNNASIIQHFDQKGRLQRIVIDWISVEQKKYRLEMFYAKGRLDHQVYTEFKDDTAKQIKNQKNIGR